MKKANFQLYSYAVSGIFAGFLLAAPPPLKAAPPQASKGDPAAGSPVVRQQTACQLSFQPIEFLQLKPRIEVILRDNGIKTAGDLVIRRPEELLKLRGIGPAALQAILAAVEEKGLSLNMDAVPSPDPPKTLNPFAWHILPAPAPERDHPPAQGERTDAAPASRDQAETLEPTSASHNPPEAGLEEIFRNVSPEMKKILERPISRLNLNKRAENALKAAGVRIAGSLVALTEPALEDLLLTEGTFLTRNKTRARREIVQNIKNGLSQSGLSLSSE